MSRSIPSISLSQSHIQANLLKEKFKKLAQEINKSYSEEINDSDSDIKNSSEFKVLMDDVSSDAFKMENPTWNFSKELRDKLNSIINQSKLVTNKQELDELDRNVVLFEGQFFNEFEKEQARTGIFDENLTGAEIEKIKKKYPQSQSRPLPNKEEIKKQVNDLLNQLNWVEGLNQDKVSKSPKYNQYLTLKQDVIKNLNNLDSLKQMGMSSLFLDTKKLIALMESFNVGVTRNNFKTFIDYVASVTGNHTFPIIT